MKDLFVYLLSIYSICISHESFASDTYEGIDFEQTETPNYKDFYSLTFDNRYTGSRNSYLSEIRNVRISYGIDASESFSYELGISKGTLTGSYDYTSGTKENFDILVHEDRLSGMGLSSSINYHFAKKGIFKINFGAQRFKNFTGKVRDLLTIDLELGTTIDLKIVDLDLFWMKISYTPYIRTTEDGELSKTSSAKLGITPIISGLAIRF